MQYRANSLPEITKNLLIINVLMFLAASAFKSLPAFLSLHSIYSPNFMPLQFVTHMFMHGNVEHIFFNMFALYMFGGEIERAFGPKRFFIYYFATGFGAAFLHSVIHYAEIWQTMSYLSEQQIQIVMAEGSKYLNSSMNYSDPDMGKLNLLINGRMLGASGAIYGLLAAFGMLYPNRVIYLIIPPIPLKAKYFVLIFGAIELYLGVAQANTGVAHFAHLGGAIFGVLLIWYWRKRGAYF